MPDTITLLTEDQAREIAERAAIRAVRPAIEQFDLKSEVMTPAQSCDYHNLARVTGQNAIDEKGLPAKTVFGAQAPGFVKSEVDVWLTAQR